MNVAQISETIGERLIVGLGNPGRRYQLTRHNLGFCVIEELAKRWQLQLTDRDCQAVVARVPGTYLAAPQTYMNRSGFSVRCLVERFHLRTQDILVVFDDANLELGRLRLRARGGPGGHRGMESIIQNLRTEEIARLRLGIASVDGDEMSEDLVEFVLSPFEPEEEAMVMELVERAGNACESWLHEGLEATMNRFNC